MTPTGLLLVLLVRASALHVRFAVTTGAPLVPLQSFGTNGGSVNVSLQLTPLACIGSNVSFDSDCWDTLDGVRRTLQRRVKLFWGGDMRWFKGKILQMNPKQHSVLVGYDDGEQKWHKMWEECFEFLAEETKPPRGPTPPRRSLATRLPR